MADRLDLAISQKRKAIEDLRHRMETAQSELRVLEQAAKETPSGDVEPPADKPKPSGRQKGSIAHTWRNVFRDMIQSGHANSPGEIQEFATKRGITITLRSANTRAREYTKAGFLEVRDGGYWVKQETIDRFKLL
jgi:hypothetical protein